MNTSNIEHTLWGIRWLSGVEAGGVVRKLGYYPLKGVENSLRVDSSVYYSVSRLLRLTIRRGSRYSNLKSISLLMIQLMYVPTTQVFASATSFRTSVCKTIKLEWSAFAQGRKIGRFEELRLS